MSRSAKLKRRIRQLERERAELRAAVAIVAGAADKAREQLL